MAEILDAEPQMTTRALGKTERLMARAMTAAWQAPMFDVVVEVDMQNALGRRSAGITLTDVILHACARTLIRFPGINAHYRDDAVHQFATANVGLAVASARGLTVPVVHGADGLTLAQIAERRRALVTKVRDGKIAIAEVMDGTFTVSNLGMFDVRRFTAILNPPQVAILAVGSTSMRHVWNNGAPEWRPICDLSLTCDHRAVDGAAAAIFLTALKAELQSSAGTTENQEG